jgi:hypothetical protein
MMIACGANPSGVIFEITKPAVIDDIHRARSLEPRGV